MLQPIQEYKYFRVLVTYKDGETSGNRVKINIAFTFEESVQKPIPNVAGVVAYEQPER
jgi:hypothetical protein